MTSSLKAIKRETKTVGQLNALRTKGLIPAVLYGGKNPNLKISVEEKYLNEIFNSESFLSTVINLNIDGKIEKVVPRDISYNVISDKPAHIDFMRIIGGSKIVLEIPVIFKNKNDSPGLKRGGVLNVVRRKVELQCVAEKIPENIKIDLTGLDIGTSIKISSVKLPTDTRPTITDRDFVVATVAPPTVVKETEKPTEEVPAEGAEGEVAATAEGEATTAPTKEGEAAKKDDKGKEQSGDKKQAGDTKPAAEKK